MNDRPGNALLVACSDGRVAPALDDLQRRLRIEDADRLLLPGGPLALTRTGAERRVVKDSVSQIVQAHDIRRIVLVSHQDCFAYERALGGLGFDQQRILERDLRRVRADLESEYLGVEVECYVIPWREESVEGASFGRAALVL
jgi:hypothetical protein